MEWIMRKWLFATTLIAVLVGTAWASDRKMDISIDQNPAVTGDTVRFECSATGEWDTPLAHAQITIWNASADRLIRGRDMQIDGLTATYAYTIPPGETAGRWDAQCRIDDGHKRGRIKVSFDVTEAAAGDPGADPGDTGNSSGTTAHESIQAYDGPQTCVACHQGSAREMLDSLHMKWAGPTTELTNTNGEELGKAVAGINTFCTYAMSSKGACFSCHVRADGNAPHAPDVNDVDCLMCHNDTYQRKFITDPDSALTVTNVAGETRTYLFGKVDAQGNYTSVPDFAKMPAGTTMTMLAQGVHKPTRTSCLRCHAKAGGGDWTKRGDMGLSTAAPTVLEDVHMSPDPGGADLSCIACHATNGHKIGGRGIDLRQTEAPDPKCTDCHSATPHSNATTNRHAAGQVACQVCHIREFGKGGATEMSRDWLEPHWNPAFCAGQGGFVGHELKVANVAPEYTWFDGTSYVYNIGETIQPGDNGVYTMAKAHGAAFDGKSKIVPIKRHATVMPLHDSGKMVPPAIMWMFMTGDFDQAVQKGMAEQGMSGGYTMVDADAEMLITHGVEPKSMAPSCKECHDNSGETPETGGMVPFGRLGYHTWPDKVKNCTLCHGAKEMSWQRMHDVHADDGSSEEAIACQSCHTSEPTGFVKSTADLCNDCHRYKNPNGFDAGDHEEHIEEEVDCSRCHQF